MALAIRITSQRSSDGFVVVVQGTLDAAASDLLRTEVARAPAGPLVLDVSGLMTFDELGLTTLRTFARHGARIAGASGYVRLLLAADTLDRQQPGPRHQRGHAHSAPRTDLKEQNE